MDVQPRIDFHGIEANEALQGFIADQVAKLERLYGRITACHVGVEPPGHHQRKGGPFRVKIHLTLPDGREVNAGTTPRADKRHADVLFAITDAFRRTGRQLQDQVKQLRGDIKVHQPQPLGRIARFDPNTGYGFIEAEDGREVYFHRNALIGRSPQNIRPGARVSFVEESGEKGPQASTVRKLGKHALRA
jgi:cold shock CspA family protein/ribosome-associated translation inhibitor RaiA